MEIADYLGVARRRRWLLVLVPLVSLGAAVAYSLLSAATYSATATVVSPSLVGTPYSQFSGPQSIDQFVSSFSASAADPAVVAQTSREAGVTASALTNNVSVAQIGASSNITLTYTGRDRAKSASVAESLAGNALENMYSAQGQVADRQVESAKKALDAANAALSAYVVKIGVGDPAAAYQAALSQVSGLQQARAGYASTGETGAADAMKSWVSAAEDRATTLGATLPQYNALLSARVMATTSYEAVVADQRGIQAQSAAAANPGVIQTSEVTSDKSRSSLVKFAIPVFGAGVLMAILLVALLEFGSALRRQRSQSSVPGEAAPDTGGATSDSSEGSKQAHHTASRQVSAKPST